MKKHAAIAAAGTFTLVALAYIAFVPAAPTTTPEPLAEQAPPATPTPPRPLTIIIGGDVMLDRAIRQKTGPLNYKIFDEALTRALVEADLAIVNLEGPVTDQASISMYAPYLAPETFNFTFEPASLKELNRVGIDAVSSGNNHIRDRGPEGVRQTRFHLEAANISHFGLPDSEASLSTITTIDGISVGLIAYNQFIPSVSDERFVELVAALASSTEFTIVVPHWGNEYEFTPSPTQSARARAWIDAGADAVVGAHPHVIQTFETYNNRTIAYSLGNLVFDQWFEESVRVGALLSFTIDRASRSYATSIQCTYLNKDGTTAAIACPPEFVQFSESQGIY